MGRGPGLPWALKLQCPESSRRGQQEGACSGPSAQHLCPRPTGLRAVVALHPHVPRPCPQFERSAPPPPPLQPRGGRVRRRRQAAVGGTDGHASPVCLVGAGSRDRQPRSRLLGRQVRAAAGRLALAGVWVCTVPACLHPTPRWCPGCSERHPLCCSWARPPWASGSISDGSVWPRRQLSPAAAAVCSPRPGPLGRHLFPITFRGAP